jgi:beta-lactamase class A
MMKLFSRCLAASFVEKTMILKTIIGITMLGLTIVSMSSAQEVKPETKKEDLEHLRTEIQKRMSEVEGKFALAFKDLKTNELLTINQSELFHAASTMKTPVMVEVFKQAREGKFALTDGIEVRNEFHSIVDSSFYTLDVLDDSDNEIYRLTGKTATVYELVHKMITVSSNLATNLLIQLVGPENVTQTMRDLGAEDILVLRGVEDGKAYRAGLNNITTAYDLLLIFEAIARKQIVDEPSCNQMINILLDQKFSDLIPAQLPKGVKVAHKTGSITGVRHDSGIVYLPNARAYVLVILSKNLKDEKQGERVIGEMSRMVYDYVVAHNN